MLYCCLEFQTWFIAYWQIIWNFNKQFKNFMYFLIKIVWSSLLQSKFFEMIFTKKYNMSTSIF